jgi:hypothetical protein
MTAPIFEHRKRGGARVIVQLREFGGSHFIDFREWVDDGEDLRATKKGCTVPPDVANQLGQALLRMASQASG